MNVISIQSQVAYGHVGNSAAVFPMQMHGIDVIAVPTTLLSNRPGYPTIRGRVLDAELVADLLLGVEERGALDSCRMILSGYLGSPEIAAVVVTSAELADTPDGEIETLAVERSQAWRVRTPKLPISPSGTGDLFASLLVSARVRGSDTPDALGHAASAIFAVLERTAARGTEEMCIVESAELLAHPKRRFDAIAMRS